MDSSSNKEVKPVEQEQKFSEARASTPHEKKMSSFHLLSKVVVCLRTRYQKRNLEPLSLHEVFSEINKKGIGQEQESLLKEFLQNNPKIEVTPNGKYLFKPLYKAHDEKSLLRLLKYYDIRGLGGIMVDDLKESFPTADKVVKKLEKENEVAVFERPNDKKLVVFYYDKFEFKVDTKFQSMWSSIRVDHLSDEAIEKYLIKNGIKPLQVAGQERVLTPVKRPSSSLVPKVKKLKHNKHVENFLEAYSPDTNSAKEDSSQSSL